MIRRLSVLAALASTLVVAFSFVHGAAASEHQLRPYLAAGPAWSLARGTFAPYLSAMRDAQPTRIAVPQRSEWWGGPTVASTGETVTLYASGLFQQDETARRSWVNFFASLYHGPELSTVTIYQGPLSEVQLICGGSNVLGCYSPSRHVLFFPGDLDPAISAVIGAHEYGHHVAASRRNDPWIADQWGTKRWASYMNVCARTAAGTLFPGDEDVHYTLNPGEGFAEAFLALNKSRGGAWATLPPIVDASLAPDSGALAALLADVQQPWADSTPVSWAGQFARPQPTAVHLDGGVLRTNRVWLRNASGTSVQRLRPGLYDISVADDSVKDNLHLRGPGVNRRTGTTGTGSALWRVALRAGTYRLFSDVHPALSRTLLVAGTPRPAAPSAAVLAPQERTISTPLDGVFQATATGTAAVSLELVDAATGQTLVAATTGAVEFTVCGQRSLRLRVTPSQAGSFDVRMAVP